MNKPKVLIVTDGSCSGNPGKGAWIAWLSTSKEARTLNGTAQETTNNRMELMAILEALKALKVPCVVELRTDSNNAIRWIMRVWKTKHPDIRNLVEQIHPFLDIHTVTFVKVTEEDPTLWLVDRWSKFLSGAKEVRTQPAPIPIPATEYAD